MIIDVNKQRVDSDFIELFIIHEGYFTTYHEQVVFRDVEAPYTARTYIPVPIEISGVDFKSEGAYARPTLIVANILDSFKDAVGVSTEDLIGKRVVRRRTLFKNLGTVSPTPIEAPIQIYVIDRKASESRISISFELASPFDLAGITIPSRYMISNTCGWVYQGASVDAVNPVVGACSWKVASNNNGFNLYLDSRNHLLITGVSPPTHNQSSAYTKDYIYAISGNRNRINVNGSTSSVSRPDYFQAYNNSSGTLNSSTGRRCIPYTTYSGGTIYYSYKEGYLYNDYVLYNNRIWRCLKSNQNVIPAAGEFWVRADVCGKKLSSCISRFSSMATSAQFSNIPSTVTDNNKVLPYGGFPATRRFNR